ncbi:hypothetical protein [Eudoraea sp.]|jgi:hypothetical protein|uniref:hypothetical protein n=1 Tax=Eudoraea sp. TaxID=1979955 RepID=UPI003C7426D3
MHRVAVILWLIVLFFLISGCGPRITPEEAKVLVVLGEIQRGVESNISFEQFDQLLTTAKAEIKILEQNTPKNPCFMSAVKKCYASYGIAKKAWLKKEDEKDPKRKEDMEMTLAFSLTFSALNINKANKCYD